MPKMIQIRHVPDEVHRTLKVRAAQEGMTLSDYLLREVRDLAERPTNRELFERAMREEPVVLDPPPEIVIREIRGE
jgi:plasmid stability protein